MGGGGSIAMMNAAIKRNERKRDKRNYFKAKRVYKSEHIEKLYKRELTRKEIRIIRLQTSNQKKKEELLNIIISVLSIGLALVVCWFLVFVLKHYYF
jgi:hypothetical protein